MPARFRASLPRRAADRRQHRRGTVPLGRAQLLTLRVPDARIFSLGGFPVQPSPVNLPPRQDQHGNSSHASFSISIPHGFFLTLWLLYDKVPSEAGRWTQSTTHSPEAESACPSWRVCPPWRRNQFQYGTESQFGTLSPSALTLATRHLSPIGDSPDLTGTSQISRHTCRDISAVTPAASTKVPKFLGTIFARFRRPFAPTALVNGWQSRRNCRHGTIASEDKRNRERRLLPNKNSNDGGAINVGYRISTAGELAAAPTAWTRSATARAMA